MQVEFYETSSDDGRLFNIEAAPTETPLARVVDLVESLAKYPDPSEAFGNLRSQLYRLDSTETLVAGIHELAEATDALPFEHQPTAAAIVVSTAAELGRMSEKSRNIAVKNDRQRAHNLAWRAYRKHLQDSPDNYQFAIQAASILKWPDDIGLARELTYSRVADHMTGGDALGSFGAVKLEKDMMLLATASHHDSGDVRLLIDLHLHNGQQQEIPDARHPLKQLLELSQIAALLGGDMKLAESVLVAAYQDGYVPEEGSASLENALITLKITTQKRTNTIEGLSEIINGAACAVPSGIDVQYSFGFPGNN